MSDQKPNDGKPNGTPPENAKANGTTPTVTARRPLSKAEYARTTKATPDATAVIPAVRDDQPAPTETSSPAARAEVDDRPTQTFKAVTADTKAPAQPSQKKPEQPQKGKKAEKKAPPVAQKKAAPAVGAAGGAAVGAAGVAAGAVPAPAAAAPAAPTAPAPAAPAAPKPEQKKAPVTKTAPAAPAPTQTPPAAAPATQTPAAAEASTATTRSARLKLSHVEPWSVTKMAFVVSVALMVVSVVAVTVFWLVLQITGVWGSLNDSVSNVLADDASGFDITDYLGFGRVVGITLLVSSLNVIFMTALATIAAHLYNLASGILGGIELTFGERK